jgi:hypothetical protein
MADLVRVRLDGVEKNVGAAFAEKHGLEVLDVSAHRPDGQVRPETRKGGRRRKPKTTVADRATAKKAAVSDSAPTTKEQS